MIYHEKGNQVTLGVKSSESRSHCSLTCAAKLKITLAKMINTLVGTEPTNDEIKTTQMKTTNYQITECVAPYDQIPCPLYATPNQYNYTTKQNDKLFLIIIIIIISNLLV